MASLRVAALAFAAVIGASITAGAASAMPADGLAAAAKQVTSVQDARYVCGPRGCWWRPGPYVAPYHYYYSPRRYYYGRYYWGRPYYGRAYWHRCYRCW